MRERRFHSLHTSNRITKRKQTEKEKEMKIHALTTESNPTDDARDRGSTINNQRNNQENNSARSPSNKGEKNYKRVQLHNIMTQVFYLAPFNSSTLDSATSLASCMSLRARKRRDRCWFILARGATPSMAMYKTFCGRTMCVTIRSM